MRNRLSGLSGWDVEQATEGDPTEGRIVWKKSTDEFSCK